MSHFPPELRVPPFIHCTTYTMYETELGVLKETSPLFQERLKQHVEKYNNVAGSIFHFSDGTTKEIYRSAFLSENEEGLRELVEQRHVTTLINLHNTNKFDLAPWIEKERNLFEHYGGKEYIYIPDFNYQFSNKEEKEQIFKKIASIIELIRHAEGNVLIHCMGGEHRSGIIFGILRKCYQQVPMEAILQEYKYHAAWQDDQNQGGYKAINAELIEDFPVDYVLK